MPLPKFIRRRIYPFLRFFSKTDVMTHNNEKPLKPVYDIELTDIHGKPHPLGQYKGKRILIVNTASECGYTPQYKQLQELHTTLGDKIAVLGFPCDDFGGQEPGSEEQIEQFCEINYGVTFPLFEKIHVVGPEKHQLYKWLTDPSLNGWNSQEPTWNFCKYVISEEGHLLHFLSAAVDPFDERITAGL